MYSSVSIGSLAAAVVVAADDNLPNSDAARMIHDNQSKL